MADNFYPRMQQQNINTLHTPINRAFHPGMQPGFQPRMINYGNPPEEKKKIPSWLWILLIILILSAIGTGIWFFIGG